MQKDGKSFSFHLQLKLLAAGLQKNAWLAGFGTRTNTAPFKTFLKMLSALCMLLGLVLALTHNAWALVVPESDFLLAYPLSLGIANDHVCTISQRHNDEEIGGEAVCYGREDHSGKLQPPSVSTFVQVITGDKWGCGLATDQTIECWGSMDKRPVPGMFTQITGATHYGCGIKIDKQIQCFGFLPKFQPITNEIGYVQMDCADDHCCALDTMAVPHCWGRQKSDSKRHPFLRPPRHLKEVSVSGEVEDGEISEEEDGYDDEEDLSSDLMQMKQISVGRHYSCGITLDNGDIQCWGAENRFHHDGSPHRFGGPFKQVSVGGAGVCGLYSKVEPHEDGHGAKSDSMECWGPQAEIFANSAETPVGEQVWDQVKVHKFMLCGVTMNSDLKCYGSAKPKDGLVPADLIVA